MVFKIKAVAGNMTHPGVAQLVARMVRDHEAVGSNPATRTIKTKQSGYSGLNA